MELEVRTVRLQAPGAGLPAVERWMLGRLLFASASIGSKRRALRVFMREADRILESVAGLDASLGRRPVLVKRVAGMEDSSRNWSAYMVLEHLVIVDTGVTGMVRALASGQAPGREVRIQDVKPRLDAGPEQIERFRQAVAAYAKTIEELPDLRSALRHVHPWFGPMDAQAWHVLAAFHHRIHRRQLQRILAGLKGK